MIVSVTKQPERKEEDISNARKARGARNQGRKEQCEWGRARPSIEGEGEGEGEGCIPTQSAPPSHSHSFPALECVWPYSIPFIRGVTKSPWELRIADIRSRKVCGGLNNADAVV